MAEARHKSRVPVGRHIAYWRKPSAKGDARGAPPLPLEPLGTRRVVGLIVVGVLVAALVLMSVGWWIRDVLRH
jgi:hypothetical protein